jgi:aminoglycoside 2''-phosphotransferase
MLLGGLDAVDWSQLSCTYGSAGDVPGRLRQLTSPSAKFRKAAMWWLTDAFYHQSTVWTASVAAIPFFIELLSAPEIGGKSDILRRLNWIAGGSYSAYPEKAVSQADDLESDTRQPQRPAVRAGVPIYLALLEDSDPTVRLAAAKLLAKRCAATFDPRPALESARARETHPGVAAGLLLSLGDLCQSVDEKVAFYAATMRAPTLTYVERLAAAIELVDLTKENAPDEAVDLLVDTLTHPSRRLDAAYNMASNRYRLARAISVGLCTFPPTRLAKAVPVLVAALPRIGRERQSAAASVLLTALFPKSPSAVLPAASLSGEQRAALEAIFAAAPYWRDKGYYAGSLGERGLPDTRPALADYLGLPLPPEDALGAVDRPLPHRPAPFTIKAYEACIRRNYGYLHLRRKKRYRFEPGPEVDLYSPNGFELFYFPKTPQAVMAMEREVTVLRALPKLPLMRWHPSDSSRDTRAAGRAFMGGFRAEGKPLTRESLEGLRGTPRWQQFATLLARFLRELHAVPLERMLLGLPPAEGREAWQRIYNEARSRLFDLLSPEQCVRLADRFESALVDPRAWAWEPAVVHGDFIPRNILHSQYRTRDTVQMAISGIVGWRHAGLGDPAADLATLLGPDGYGEEFVLAFADEYPSLETELPRARWYASVQLVRDALAAPAGTEREAVDRLLARADL